MMSVCSAASNKLVADREYALQKENSEMNREVVETLAKPKQVTVQKSDGTTLKASVRTLN